MRNLLFRVFWDFSGQSLTTRILAFTFWCQKVTKNSALGKNLHKRPLLRPPQGASLRSGTCSSLQAFACFRGAAERTPCGNFEKYNCRITFERSSHNVPKTIGLALDFSTVPLDKLLALAAKSQINLDFAHLRVTFRRWWRNYLCYEYPLLHFANFIAYNGNVK